MASSSSSLLMKLYEVCYLKVKTQHVATNYCTCIILHKIYLHIFDEGEKDIVSGLKNSVPSKNYKSWEMKSTARPLVELALVKGEKKMS